MTTISDHEKWMSGGYQAVGKVERERYQKGDGVEEKGSNESLPAAGREGYREVVGRKEEREEQKIGCTTHLVEKNVKRNVKGNLFQGAGVRDYIPLRVCKG